MPTVTLAPLSGRYLSFEEREEIAILHARQLGVRGIARRVGRSPSTISRELRRNASSRSYGTPYRATTAQWHAERRGLLSDVGSGSMVGSMGAPRSRTPNEPGARDIAGALYPDLHSVEWIPSDDADVFRLTFASGREPRILKMAAPGIRAVWREIGAFPAMRRLGIPEVLEFEHTSDDLPDPGIEFHVTVELAHPQQASRAMADLWASDRARALDAAHWFGECTRRIESLDWRRVPRANSPEQSVAIGATWREPQYAQLLARSDCPAWARTFIEQVSRTLSRPEAFDSFGGWAGEMLRAPDGRLARWRPGAGHRVSPGSWPEFARIADYASC
jgi:helix-turn-helix protein